MLAPHGRRAYRLLSVIEIVTRATYVYAWAAFESLLDWAMEELTRWRPQQVVERQKAKAVEILGQVAAGTMTHDELLANLVSREQKALASKSLSDQRTHFAAWGAEWSDEMYRDLERVVDRRNRAAHDWTFAVPTDDEINDDLVALILHGRRIVDAVLRRVTEADKEKGERP